VVKDELSGSVGETSKFEATIIAVKKNVLLVNDLGAVIGHLLDCAAERIEIADSRFDLYVAGYAQD